MRFDHLVHWVPHLETAARAYRALGFPLQAGGRHTPHGTRNVIWRTASAYVELLAFEGDAPAQVRLSPEWPALAALLDAGGSALPFAILVDDVAATVRELRARGVDVDVPRPGSFQLPDGTSAGWMSAALRQGPVWAPFFINYGLPVDEWIARGRQDPIVSWSLERLVIETPEPAGAAAWLAHLLGICPSGLTDGTVGLPLPGCVVGFAPGPANRITTVVLTGTGAPSGEIAGLRYVGDAGHDRRPPADAVSPVSAVVATRNVPRDESIDEPTVSAGPCQP